MTRAPRLFRSVTFWSGFLAMAFVVWAWQDSFRNRSVAGGRSISIGQAWGFAAVAYDPDLWGGQSMAGYREKRDPAVAFEWAPPPFLVSGKGGDSFSNPLAPDRLETNREFHERLWATRRPASWLVGVPHWLILFAVALPWSGLLYGRHRRIRKAAIPIPVAPPP